jgi:hypothetical protein
MPTHHSGTEYEILYINAQVLAQIAFQASAFTSNPGAFPHTAA